MDGFQLEVVERLARVEAKLDNGVVAEVRKLNEWIEKWTDVHPPKCPLVERKAQLTIPIVVGAIAGSIVVAIELILAKVL